MKNLLFFSMVLFLTACSLIGNEGGNNLKAGDALPQFTVTDLDSNTYTEKDFSQGKGLIVFFHSVCPDCVEEMPLVQELHELYPEMKILAISRKENEQGVKKFRSQHGFTFPMSAQEDDSVYKLFATTIIPRTYFIYDGIIRYVWSDSPIMEKIIFEKEYSKYP